MNPLLLESLSDEFPIGYIIAAIIAFGIAVFVTRWIFDIPRIVRSLHANAYLLALIAEKQGCDADKISSALKHLEGEAIVTKSESSQQ